MAEQSEISWTDSTFNPWIGCTKVGPGCDFCYAERDFDLRKHLVKWGTGQPRHRTKTWGEPIKWQNAAMDFFIKHERKRRVFSASLADIFDNEVPPEWRTDFFNLVARCPDLEWLIVTKRIGNVAKMLPADWNAITFGNVIVLITVVNQEEANRDIPKLLELKKRYPWLRVGLSIEPILGRIDLEALCNGSYFLDCLAGLKYHDAPEGVPSIAEVCPHVDWVIVGGESGPKARPAHPHWVRSIQRQCANASVPFHFKQWGEWAPLDDDSGKLQVTHLLETGEEVAEHDCAANNDNRLTRIGKAKAGRLLDGVEYNGFPRAA